jgi:predicted dehydrogenase
MQYQQELGFAIVGCGLIGRRRFESLPPGSLRFACDLNLQRARELADRSENCTATTELDVVLSARTFNVILVATTNAALAPLALSAVRAGKHVLVEKPGAVSARQLKEIQSEARLSGVLVRIGYNDRFHPAFLRAYEIASTEDVGQLMFIRGRYGHGGRLGYDEEWRANPGLGGGGELIDQGVHLIDLAASFIGEFSTVDGHVATYFWNMAVDDNAFVSLRDSQGKTAWLQASCTEWKNLFSFEIYFQRAKLQVEGLGGQLRCRKALLL